MIKLLDKFTFLGPVGHSWVACGLPDPCGLRKRLPLTNIPQAWQEAGLPLLKLRLLHNGLHLCQAVFGNRQRILGPIFPVEQFQ